MINIRVYNKREQRYLEDIVRPNSLNYQTDIRNFTGSIDLSFLINTESDLKKVKSQDYVEMYFTMPNGVDHQVGVCYLDDFNTKTSPESMNKSFNGYELIAQTAKPPFAKNKHFESSTLLNFANEVVKGEYLGDYCSKKGIPSVVGVSTKSRKMRMSTDLTQTKGALLQQYADLSINTVYQNRLGQLIVYGGVDSRNSLGILQKGKNVNDFTISGSYSKVFSEVICFYSSAQAQVDSNKLKTPTFVNEDKRVRGVIYNPTFKTFASNDLQVFDTTPENRMAEVARSLLRKSNSFLSQVVVSSEEPFYRDGDNYIPYEVGQVWTLRSDMEEIETKNNPDGTKESDMELAGIFYTQDESSANVQLMFVEVGTLV